MASENTYTDLFETEIKNNLFEIDMSEQDNNNEKLPIELFKEIEVELLDNLLHNKSNADSDGETDGSIDVIRKIVDSVKEEFDGVVEEGERKTFLYILTKILATVLSVKADSIEKIIKLVKLTVSTVVKSWAERN